MEDAVYKAGFTPVLHMPQAEMLELPESNPDIQAKLVFRLWNHDQESAVIYRNPETDESFAVIIATSQKFRSIPQRFLVGIVDGISPGISETAIVDDFFKDDNHSLTDLSTRLLVKFLRSGRQVILSMNAFSVGSTLHFKLWVVVEESKI
jgi:DNA polymerase IIIc chi subunit